MKISRKNKKPRAEPVPFNPWQPPPFGSLGDCWDGILDLPKTPEDLRRAEEERQEAERKAAARRRKQLAAPKYRPRLHWLAVGGWICVALGTSSYGPAAFLRPIWAATALGLAIACLILLRDRHNLERGKYHCLGIILAAAALIAWNFRDAIPGLQRLLPL